ncbi:MAG: permease [Deltaproteobacteria bacterium]|nr:permease [Deltaproteobacteria bacterium]MBW2071416.1 permease [Deltaproteobacteria bacterium]
MNGAFIIMAVLAAILGAIAFQRDPGLPIQALRSGGALLVRILPILILAFFVAGLMEVLLPKEVLVRWVGAESGLKGLFVGTFLGLLTPGGPLVQFPIVAAMFKAGVSIGPLIAYLSAWALLSINRVIVFEIPILGLHLTATRLICSLVFPVIIGYMSKFVFRWLQ